MTQTEQLQDQIADHREMVERKDLALKLEKNPEFKKLILEAFCEKECARFARSSSDPALSAEEQKMSLAMAQSAGHLQRWLSMTVQMGMQAERAIKDCEEAIVEIAQNGEEG